MAFERATNIQFDADGDTLLLLEEGTVQFQVSSSVLCLASPVFHAMLGANGKFKESKSLRERKDGEPPTEITLRDDNADALAVIFRILHHQHDSVPKSLSEENLWQIAILVDKYDLREATKLWVDLWIPHHFSDVGLPLALNSYFRDDRGVFLAYAFCNEIMFESISKNIILTWCATTDEYRLHPSFFSFTPSFEFVPQSIAEGLYHNRKKCVDEICNCISRYIKLYSGSPQGDTQCALQSNQSSCDSIVLGKFIRHLTQNRLPIDSDKPIHLPVERIEDLLLKIEPCKHVFFDNASTGSISHINHAACFPLEKFKNEISRIIDKVEGLKLASFARKPHRTTSSNDRLAVA